MKLKILWLFLLLTLSAFGQTRLHTRIASGGEAPPSPPAAPANLAPVDNATDVALTQQLTWDASAGATGYDVYFGSSSPAPVVLSDTASTSYDPALSNSTTYYQKICAKNTGGQGCTAETSFTTVAAPAGVIFSENFDSQADWTVAQSTTTDRSCYTPTEPDQGNFCSTTAPPTNWHGYYNGRSYCTAAGYNSMYINAIAGYPYEVSGACRGGSGKCMTHWDEGCTDSMVNSDADLYVDLGAEYNEIYIMFWIKFGHQLDGSDYEMHDSSLSGGHKFTGGQHYLSGAPWQYFANNTGNQPIFVADLGNYNGYVLVSGHYRGECGFANGEEHPGYDCGTCYEMGDGTHPPTYSFDVGCDKDEVTLGTWATTLIDGNWHSLEIHAKMNTYNSGTSHFNADGVFQYWVDGTLRIDSSTVPFNSDGAETSPVRGWRLVRVNGNAALGGIAFVDSACEEWHALDDITISTSRIGS